MRFELMNKLGEGTHGVVYRARDTATGDIVAVKVVSARAASREELLLARKITHKNVCRVNDLYPEDDRFLISMEYVEGETLRSLLNRVQTVPVDEALALGHQIIDGLEEAHACGVIHRDLKPENITITPDGFVKVMDFGFACLTELLDDTLWDRATGSRKYMAPEQVEAQRPDPRIDIYSLGVILQEMLGGAEALDVPDYVKQAIECCRQRDPALRFDSVADLRNAVIVGGDALAAGAGAHRAPLQARRTRATIMAAGIAVLALVVAGGTMFSQRAVSSSR